MPTDILFILALRSIAAVILLGRAIRDGLGFFECLRWGGMGFITGIIGLITRWRMDRHDLRVMHVVQDAVVNLGMEVIALYGIPYFLN